MSPPKNAPAGMPAVILISHSPPSKGVLPITVFAMSGTVTMPMISAAPTRRCVMLAVTKAGTRNIAGGRRGSVVLRCRTMKSRRESAAPATNTPPSQSNEPIREKASVVHVRAAATSAPPTTSMEAGNRGLGRSMSRMSAIVRTARGMLIQNTQRQSRYRIITPPHSGPITPPASAAAPTMPRGIARFPRGKRSPTIAIAIGTRAPAPMAWNTRAAIIQLRLCVRATATDPTMNARTDRM